MGRTYDAIDPVQARWIERQPMFFVATAPRDDEGRVNVSPKGPGRTFRLLGPLEAAYLDVVGSGAETIAHLRENGRITVMFCAFEGPPRILRLYGRGEVLLPGDPGYEALVEGFDEPTPVEARRAVIRIAIERIADACGYAVPLMRFEGERPHLPAWQAKQLRVGGPDALVRYQGAENAESIDGLPAVPART